DPPGGALPPQRHDLRPHVGPERRPGRGEPTTPGRRHAEPQRHDADRAGERCARLHVHAPGGTGRTCGGGSALRLHQWTPEPAWSPSVWPGYLHGALFGYTQRFAHDAGGPLLITTAVERARRCALAPTAQRLPALGGRLPADAALAGRWLVRSPRPRPAHSAAPGRGTGPQPSPVLFDGVIVRVPCTTITGSLCTSEKS